MPRFIRQRGTLDLYDENALLFNRVIEGASKVAKLFNFSPIIVPTFESTGLYARSTGESSDIVTKEMYNFKDKGDRDIALRPEGTAGVIRAIVENKLYATNDLPLRYYYHGSFFRYERAQFGRYREFSQFGVEVVGTNSYLDDILCINLITSILKELGINEYKIRLNTFGNVACRNAHRDNIKAFIEPHLPNLCEDCKNRFIKNPLRILDCKVDKEYLEKLDTPVSLDALDEENKQIFNKILEILDQNEIAYEIDKYLVRGLDYYTGIIYEVDVTFNGGKVLTIGGGGRYSNLVKELDGPDLNCVGFGLGINRIALALEELYGKEAYANKLDYYVMPLCKEAEGTCLKVANILRNNNKSVVVETNSKSVSSMFKFANKKGFDFAVMIGEDELANNQVKVKNLKTQEQYFVSIEELKG